MWSWSQDGVFFSEFSLPPTPQDGSVLSGVSGCPLVWYKPLDMSKEWRSAERNYSGNIEPMMGFVKVFFIFLTHLNEDGSKNYFTFHSGCIIAGREIDVGESQDVHKIWNSEGQPGNANKRWQWWFHLTHLILLFRWTVCTSSPEFLF